MVFIIMESTHEEWHFEGIRLHNGYKVPYVIPWYNSLELVYTVDSNYSEPERIPAMPPNRAIRKHLSYKPNSSVIQDYMVVVFVQHT